MRRRSNLGGLLVLSLAAASALLGQVEINNPTGPPGPYILPLGYSGIAYSYDFTATVSSSKLQVTWTAGTGPTPLLPSGITLMPNGVLSGTTAQQGTFTFPVTAQAGNFTDTETFVLTIQGPVITINPPYTLPSGFIGQTYSQLLTSTSNPAGDVWFEAQVAPGLNLTTSGLISGTPTAAGTFTPTVTAEIAGTTITTTQTLTITIYAGQVFIQTTALPQEISGKTYVATLSGSPQGIVWSVNGQLPLGITFNTATGIFGGSTVQTGAYPIQVTASATGYLSAMQNLILYVTTGVLAIPQPVLPAAVQGSPYTTTVGAAGGLVPYQWSFVTTSTNGLSIGATTGTITGTPTTAGNFFLPVSLSDATGQSITVNLSLFVATPLSVLTASLPNGNIGVAYSQSLMAGGGTPPVSWLIVPGSGSLPGGLSLAPSGVISGTPTASGTARFTVQATDNGGRTATKALTLSVSVTALSITSASLPNGQLSVPYSQTLAATGGVAPYTWTLAPGSGPLPQGLTLNPNGTISGTPSGALAISTFTVQATDSSPTPLTAQKAFTINIALTLNITTQALPTGTKGVVYGPAQILASGGTSPLTWSIVSGALPGGLTLNPTSGAISGTPTAIGTSLFTVAVTDAAGQTSNSPLSITINPAAQPPGITTSGNFPATIGVAFPALTLAATGGTPPYTWAASGLPGGLQLSGSAISGTPTASGAFPVTLTVTDSQQLTASASITITVAAAPLVTLSTIAGAPATQPSVNLTLGNTFPAPITVILSASFQSAVGGNPTEVGFITSGGGRVSTTTFTIPAGSTSIPSASAPVLATGTVAGTITVTATLNAGGVPLPSPATQTITVAGGPPVIETVTFSNSGGGLSVSVVGYSTTREMVSGQFQFNTSTGPILLPVTVQLGSAFSTWYQNSASNQYGSQFTVTIPFTVAGTATDIVSVTATLINTKGNSQSLQTVPAN